MSMRALSRASWVRSDDGLCSTRSFCSQGTLVKRNSIARKSPRAALFTACMIINSNLLIVMRRPFSRTSTRASSACLISVAELLEPRGLPLGFPERPF